MNKIMGLLMLVVMLLAWYANDTNLMVFAGVNLLLVRINDMDES